MAPFSLEKCAEDIYYATSAFTKKHPRLVYGGIFGAIGLYSFAKMCPKAFSPFTMNVKRFWRDSMTKSLKTAKPIRIPTALAKLPNWEKFQAFKTEDGNVIMAISDGSTVGNKFKNIKCNRDFRINLGEEKVGEIFPGIVRNGRVRRCCRKLLNVPFTEPTFDEAFSAHMYHFCSPGTATILEAPKEGILPALPDCRLKRDLEVLINGLETNFEDESIKDMNASLNRTFGNLFRYVEKAKIRAKKNKEDADTFFRVVLPALMVNNMIMSSHR
eukprot:TRINITY_DN15254_c0_g1_i2.p1 TRINITY_DN15254_c0_g1~~TRINITY_DN15254_c0_g1_i2.p1  ORF type:complete len:272 (+),score=63.76 TRINITY_DN15254_c0_g1_i2:57-872(+)